MPSIIGHCRSKTFSFLFGGNVEWLICKQKQFYQINSYHLSQNMWFLHHILKCLLIYNKPPQTNFVAVTIVKRGSMNYILRKYFITFWKKKCQAKKVIKSPQEMSDAWKNMRHVSAIKHCLQLTLDSTRVVKQLKTSQAKYQLLLIKWTQHNWGYHFVVK